MLNKLLFTLCICFSILLLSHNSCYAQKIFSNYPFDTSNTYIIKLIDEDQFICKFLAKDTVKISIKTNSIPLIEIPLTKIKSISIVESLNLRNGVYWFPNPNPTRYLFSPSAYNLKKGEGYYQNTYILLNSFNVGITDNFSFGGGFEFTSTFIVGQPIFFLTPKLGFKINKKLHLGGGIMYASVPSFYSENSNRSSLGFLYGLSTFGNEEKNFTTGLGWGFVDNSFSANPFITISGLIRLSRKAAFVTENWFIPTNGYTALFSYGIRFFGEKLSVDLAFINNPEIARGIGIGVPYADFVVKF